MVFEEAELFIHDPLVPSVVVGPRHTFLVVVRRGNVDSIFLKNPVLPVAVLNCITPIVDGSVNVKTFSTYLDSAFVLSMLLVKVVTVASSESVGKP